MRNPAETPETGERELSPAESARLAKSQKRLIAAVMLPHGAAAFEAPIVWLACSAIALVLFVVSVLGIGQAFAWRRSTVALTFIAMCIPLVNLIALLIVNGRVTRALRRSGYRVGLFGAS